MTGATGARGSAPLPPKLLELVDELDQEVRSLPVARALSGRGIGVQLAVHAVAGLKQLLDGERERAARTFEAISEEIRDRTVSAD